MICASSLSRSMLRLVGQNQSSVSQKSLRLLSVTRGLSKATTKATRTCSIIPVPISMGQPLIGVEKTPDLLLKHGLINVLKDNGWKYKQCEDVTKAMRLDGTLDKSRAKHVGEIGANCKLVMEQVQNEVCFVYIYIYVYYLYCIYIICIFTIRILMNKYNNTTLYCEYICVCRRRTRITSC
jgi:hypothetical protein